MKIEPTDRFVYDVHSESRRDVIHRVDLMSDECSCEDFTYSRPKRRCKHILACREYFLDYILQKANEEENSLRRKPENKFQGIDSISEKKKIEMKEYMRRRKAFLKVNPNCLWSGAKSEDIHHSRGRAGSLLLDMRYWFAVSRITHEKIHRSPQWAKENNLLSDWLKADPDYQTECIECNKMCMASELIDEMCVECVNNL